MPPPLVLWVVAGCPRPFPLFLQYFWEAEIYEEPVCVASRISWRITMYTHLLRPFDVFSHQTYIFSQKAPAGRTHALMTLASQGILWSTLISRKKKGKRKPKQFHIWDLGGWGSLPPSSPCPRPPSPWGREGAMGLGPRIIYVCVCLFFCVRIMFSSSARTVSSDCSFLSVDMASLHVAATAERIGNENCGFLHLCWPFRLIMNYLFKCVN